MVYHKPTLTLRSIVSCVNTPTTSLSTFVASILSTYLSACRNRYHVEDSFTFASYINEFRLPDGYVLISLDVVSLFSNVSLSLAVSAVEKKWDAIASHTSIPRDDFISIIRFLFESNYFVFNGNFYLQILGCPMGSSSSSPIAEIAMDFLLDDILADVPFCIPLMKKYVDDIICSVPEDKVSYILDRFNSQHHGIQFTMEEETNRSIPFLDTRVIRTSENRLILDWYQKPSSSGRYLHYHSNHTLSQKVNMILGLKNRI